MQLSLARSQARTLLFRRPVFMLWARADLTMSEVKLIDKYEMHDAVLSEGDEERNLRARKRSRRYALLTTFLVTLSIVWYLMYSLRSERRDLLFTLSPYFSQN